MPCYHPVDMWDTGTRTPNGKRLFVHSYSPYHDYVRLSRPCGMCIGCRLKYSADWAIRMMHEAKMHSDNCFVTLTYDSEHCPLDRSLNKKHLQDFMKRLRSYYSPKKIRFYAVGEYGTEFGRPHFHLILFGHDFSDKKYWRKAKCGEKCYRSADLEKLWTFGNSEIGSVSFDSCAYLSRYVTKKVNGERADDHYFDSSTGVYRVPEFARMSLKPGIGANFYAKFKADIFPSDQVIIKGFARKPPKYYDTLLQRYDPEDFDLIKTDRYYAARAAIDDNTPDRLLIKEQVKLAKLKTLKRSIQ